jgi:hypothetical protein
LDQDSRLGQIPLVSKYRIWVDRGLAHPTPDPSQPTGKSSNSTARRNHFPVSLLDACKRHLIPPPPLPTAKVTRPSCRRPCSSRCFYTYDAFIAVASSFLGFGTTGGADGWKREVAALLAQTSHETTAGGPPPRTAPTRGGTASSRSWAAPPRPTTASPAGSTRAPPAGSTTVGAPSRSATTTTTARRAGHRRRPAR